MRKAIEKWWFDFPSGTEAEIWCYTDRFSYAPGEDVSFHVHTTAARYSIAIYRDGAELREMHRSAGLSGTVQTTPEDCSETGCDWPVSFTLQVPDDWPSGGYVAYLTGTLDDRTVRHEHWFAVRAAQPDPSALLLVAATSTWIAYNAWGGSSYYEGVHGRERNLPSPRLSTQRPWGKGLAWLPQGAPRETHDSRIPLGWVPRYPGEEWAYGAGFPKYTQSAGWAMYESHFVRWAERQGYGVHVITQHDLHERPSIVYGYRCVVLVGHDEYWSWEMRDALDGFVEAGGRVARFAANFHWQVRLEHEGRVQVCYKHAARREDPVRNDRARRHTLTSCWDDPLIGRPGASTMGATASRGMFAKCGAAAPRGSGGYTVYRQNHWAFEGCDLYYGDVLGAEANVFGYEVDGLAYTMRDGLPYASGEDGVSPNAVDILAMNPATVVEEHHGNDGTALFVGDVEAAFLAEILHGESSPETIDRVSRGNGAMVVYRHGLGEVFNASSIEWVNGLRLREPFVERATNNVLNRFLEER
jgi:hypothetical protein